MAESRYGTPFANPIAKLVSQHFLGEEMSAEIVGKAPKRVKAPSDSKKAGFASRKNKSEESILRIFAIVAEDVGTQSNLRLNSPNHEVRSKPTDFAEKHDVTQYPELPGSSRRLD